MNNKKFDLCTEFLLFLSLSAFCSSCLQPPASSSGGATRFNTTNNMPTAALTPAGTPTQPPPVSEELPVLSLNGAVKVIKKLRDGRFLVGGDFTFPAHLALMDASGSLDVLFNTNSGMGANSTILTLAITTNNQIILGGDFTDFSGTAMGHIAKINTDGTLDDHFTQNIGTGFNERVSSIVILSDNKILVVGDFTEFNSVSAVRVIRLNENGSQDETYGTPTQPSVLPTPSPTLSPSPTPKSSKKSSKKG